MQRSVVAVGLTVMMSGALVACGSTSGSGDSATTSPSGPASASSSSASTTITVLAAASLTEAFGTLGTQYEAAHPGVSVKFSFAASSALAQQVIQGAPADVFASAATKNMQQVTAAHAADAPTNFVSNEMAIVVPPKNPAGITSVADLAKKGVKVALCQPQVPCGATAKKVLANAKVSFTPTTLEPNVKSTLTKVELDEVDAGMVYVTDARAAGSKVNTVPVPDAVNASTSYPIATLSHAPNPSGGKAFVTYVLSVAGQKVLAADGFAKP